MIAPSTRASTRRAGVVFFMCALASPVVALAQGASWRPAPPMSPAERDALLAEVTADAVRAQSVWRAGWHLSVDLGGEFLVTSRFSLSGFQHAAGPVLAPSVGVGARRMLRPWLDLDLRGGAAFPITLLTLGEDNGQCDAYSAVGDDGGEVRRRGGALLSVAAALRARPGGALHPFFLSVGLRGNLALAAAADPLRYRCAVVDDPSTPEVETLGATRESARPLGVAASLALTAGMGAHFGPRERFGVSLQGWWAPGVGWRGGGVAALVTVSLY